MCRVSSPRGGGGWWHRSVLFQTLCWFGSPGNHKSVTSLCILSGGSRKRPEWANNKSTYTLFLNPPSSSLYFVPYSVTRCLFSYWKTCFKVLKNLHTVIVLFKKIFYEKTTFKSYSTLCKSLIIVKTSGIRENQKTDHTGNVGDNDSLPTRFSHILPIQNIRDFDWKSIFTVNSKF